MVRDRKQTGGLLGAGREWGVWNNCLMRISFFLEHENVWELDGVGGSTML